MFSKDTGFTLKSAIAGVLAGLIGSLAMNQFQDGLSALSEADHNRDETSQQQQAQKQEVKGGDATVNAAQVISRAVLHHDLGEAEKKWAGPLVHYAMGGTTGAAYSVLAAAGPLNAGIGAAYGVAVWLFADEISVPALGLAPPPWRSSAASHGKALASHLVFGVATHATRKLVLRLLGG